jgi:hypothetical protein
MQSTEQKQKGVILLLSIVVLGILLTMSSAVVGYTSLQLKAERQTLAQGQALALAEAGIDKAIAKSNQDPNYNGESGTVLGNGELSITISSLDTNTKQVTSTAYVPNSSNPTATKTVKASMSINTYSVAFNFGLQSGVGGLTMANGSQINGNVYSNGNITGSGTITGVAIVAGGTAATADQSWTTVDGDSVLGNISNKKDLAQSFTPSVSNVLNKVSLYLKKVGTPTDLTVKILTDNSGSPSKTAIATGTISASTITGSYGYIDASFSASPSLTAGTKYWILLDSTVNASNYFYWGIDSAQGYASGTGKYSANWNASSPVWNNLNGDLNFKAFMGGVTTKISGVRVNGNAKANTLESCTILGDAYFSSVNTCSVGGTQHASQPDPAPQAMPISDAKIADWESIAEEGGVIEGDYAVSGTVTMGPKKINGNLTVNGTLVMTGPIWVTGNITFSNNSAATISSSMGNAGVTLLADSPTNPATKGIITVNNNVTFSGNGNVNSFPLVLTTNTSTSAMALNNNASGAIFYAANGTVNVYNNANATQVNGNSINLSNNVTITYINGLAGADFSDGPGGSWQFIPGTYFISK